MKPAGGIGRAIRAGLAILIVGAAGLAFARSPDIGFPKTVGDFALKRTTDYESQQRGAGQGGSYQGPNAFADVYIYSHGRNDLPANYRADIVAAELDSAAKDIRTAADLGLYRSVTATGRVNVPSSGKNRFDCRSYRIVSQQGQTLGSVLCVTIRDGNFVKIRLTHPQGSSLAKAETAFITAWYRLGARRQ